MRFRYFNPNLCGTQTEDCVKRAIVAVTGFSYTRVQRELNAYKKITGAKTFNASHNPHRYVEEVLGAKKLAVPSHMTVESFCKAHPHGRYILDMKGHWSCCIEGEVYDTWDCGEEVLNFVYEVSTTPYSPPDLAHQIFKYCCTSKRVSESETCIRIYDGNGTFVERRIPTALTAGYVLCLQHSNYRYIDLD